MTNIFDWINQFRNAWGDNFQALGDLVLYAWIISFVNLVLCGGALNEKFGIQPRTWLGLVGILFSPFLHKDWKHLIGNTIPFALLGCWVLLRGTTDDFWVVTLVIVVVGGLAEWLLGSPNTVSYGASGLVFGYVAFLIGQGYLEGNSLLVIGSIAIGGVYGFTLRGLLPGETGISWQGHLFGFLAGMLAASNMDTFRNMFL